MKTIQFLDALLEGKFTHEDKPIYVAGYGHERQGNTVSIIFTSEDNAKDLKAIKHTFRRHLESELSTTVRLVTVEEQGTKDKEPVVTNATLPLSEIITE